jgi:hypothetical protein
MTLRKTLALLLITLAAAAPALQATTRAVDYPGSVAILLGISGVRGDLELTSPQKSRLNAIRKELRTNARAIAQAPSVSRTTAPEAVRVGPMR